jgi:hypothetical protein
MEQGLTNITSADTFTLIPIYGSGGSVSSIRLTNYSAANAVTIGLYLEDAAAAKSYMLNDLVIPVGGSLLLDEHMSFDNSVLGLKIVTVGSSPLLSVIIK